jgi:predicted PhzF superfamily epimerase YddE/YHI9
VVQRLTDTDRLSPPYVAAQGTALGRSGRVHLTEYESGSIWVGGNSATCIEKTADI